MAGHLWDDWVPQGTREVIAKEFGDPDDPESLEAARSLLVFLAGTHDIGKATPSFQSEEWYWTSPEDGLKQVNSLREHTQRAGFGFHATADNKDQRVSHPLAGELILGDYLTCRLASANGVVDARTLLGPVRPPNRAVRSLSCILGAHHGVMPDEGALKRARGRWKGCARRDTTESASRDSAEQKERDDYCRPWVHARLDLLDAVWKLSGMHDEWLRHVQDTGGISIQSQSLLTALVIMADWLASNQTVCPLVAMDTNREVFIGDDGQELGRGLLLDSPSDLDKRDERAWKQMNLEGPWSENQQDIPADDAQLFKERFNLPKGASPRPVQEAAVRLAKTVRRPGLMVIEAPMGEGKTEAALAAAEIMAQRTHRGGICFALPTMATTDAMFSRVERWVGSLPQTRRDEKTIYLAHSKARLNEEYQGIIRQSWRQRFADIDADGQQEDVGSEWQRHPTGTAIASDWLSGRKKGVLSNFLICTVDQVLMAALSMKHVVLRQLALANKVVIIDECHAYDEYMREYLKSALTWLGSMGSPVIMLSATLPESMRKDYVSAYQEGIRKFDQEGAEKQDDDADWFASSFNVANIDGKSKAGSSQSSDGPSGDGEVSRRHQAELFKEAYPLLTCTDGVDDVVREQSKAASGRSLSVRLKVIDDGLDTLCDQVSRLVGKDNPSGCVGIICDTVSRAQKAANRLRRIYGDAVRLTHSRFIDIDRMSNEQELRALLGPDATAENGLRPRLLIVIGTQVLEQSLDIDFDALITDVAPIDSLIQRLGRLHRHHRGNGEKERPERMRKSVCLVRGIDDWNDDGPSFPDGIAWNTERAQGVYAQSRLEETLGILGLIAVGAQTDLNLPGAIAGDVRRVYGSAEERRHLIPSAWTNYQSADDACQSHAQEEQGKAKDFLFKESDPSQTLLVESRSYVDSAHDEAARCAVRDTTDSVQVILMRRLGDEVRFLPWIGGSASMSGQEGKIASKKSLIDLGSSVSTSETPSDAQGQLMAQCSITLPRTLGYDIDKLVSELEEDCGQEVINWQDSRWVAGSLFVFLNANGEARIAGKTVRYSRESGLVVSDATSAEA